MCKAWERLHGCTGLAQPLLVVYYMISNLFSWAGSFVRMSVIHGDIVCYTCVFDVKFRIKSFKLQCHNRLKHGSSVS